MKILQFLLILPILVFTLSGLYSQENDQEYFIACIGYYNLENLFDTIDSPDIEDFEFTPQGDARWDHEKYQKKLQNLASVISQIGKDVTPDGLVILGFSEVENRDVVEDLVKTKQLTDAGYKIIHHDSPDRRGIDVGFIYKPDYFLPVTINAVPLIVEDNEDFVTRDQLVVTGKLAGEEISLIVMHWPSRRGGEKRSKPYRAAAADLCRHIVDSLLSINPEAKIITLGDFNDNPKDESIKHHLKTSGKVDNLKGHELYNPMEGIYKKGIGTTAWRDSWSLFDQMMVSKALTGKDYTTLKLYKTFVFNKDFLEQPEGRYKGYPWRTYAGGIYLGGYSDHYPVYMYLIKEI